jgi:hypothetical protein
MQHIKTSKIIALIVSFAFSILGCTTDKSHSNIKNIVLKAEAVSEGISLSFNYIPSDATRLFIYISEYDENINSSYDIVSTYADIRGSVLEDVRNSCRINLPFVKAGQKYSVSASFHKDDDFKEIDCGYLLTECTPYSGIFFDNSINLSLDEARTNVTLSSEPIFYTEINYSSPKYEINVKILPGEKTTGLGAGSFKNNISSNILTYYFEPEMKDEIMEGNYLESGNYPAYVTAYCNIIYENIKWNIEIAKTQEFIYSL